MAINESAHDKPLSDAWRQFCERLLEAGNQAFKDSNPAAPLHRADAFRFLTQNLGQAFDLALETKDTRFPIIHAFCTPFCKLGGDNADFVYQQAWIHGESVYRISGNRGSARFLNFTVQGPRPQKPKPAGQWNLHEPFGDTPEANLFGDELETSWDGSFELYIGGPKRGPNWLPTTPGSRKLFLRQGFDRWSELPARMRIERIDMSEPRPVATPEVMVEAIEWAGNFIAGAMRDWPDWVYACSEGHDPAAINQFPTEHRPLADPVYNTRLDRLRGRSIINMSWRLKPDESLIVEFDHHERFWMLTNMGVFFNSMDYLYRPVSYTPSRTHVNGDGKIRLILAHEDPGYHNWIDTQGFEQGNLTNRNLFTDQFTDFRTRVVKRSELASALPADTARVSREERVRQLRERFHAILQRYCL